MFVRKNIKLGVIVNLSDIFDGYNITTTLFQNGTFIDKRLQELYGQNKNNRESCCK